METRFILYYVLHIFSWLSFQWTLCNNKTASRHSDSNRRRDVYNKKHLKNVGPIRYCKPPLHCQSPGAASRTPAIAIAQAACDVHDNNNNNNNNAWQRGPLWPHGMGPIRYIYRPLWWIKKQSTKCFKFPFTVFSITDWSLLKRRWWMWTMAA